MRLRLCTGLGRYLAVMENEHQLPREASGKPTASVSVPERWKMVSGGVKMSERQGYEQLVRRSCPV